MCDADSVPDLELEDTHKLIQGHTKGLVQRLAQTISFSRVRQWTYTASYAALLLTVADCFRRT